MDVVKIYGVATTRGVHGEVKLQYETWGSGPQAVLFMHGGVGGAASVAIGKILTNRKGSAYAHTPMYTSLLESLSSNRRQLIIYDRRGCGNSTRDNESWYTLEDCVEDAVAVLDALRLPSAVVLGTSAGGPIALSLCAKYPDRVKAKPLVHCPVLVRATTFSRVGDLQFKTRRSISIPPMVPFAEKILPKLYKNGRQSELQFFADHGIAEKLRQEVGDEDIGPFWIGQIHEELQQFSSEILFDCWRASIRNCAIYRDASDALTALDTIRTPTLIIHGDNDAIVPFTAGKHLRARLSQATFHALAGCGHGVAGDPMCRRIVRQWLDDLRGSSVSKI